MKFLIIDGNSILNRAFYGIRLLSTKDGRFTNGIYGFLSIFIKLRDTVNPDAVAIAFDLKAPTFRHKMYDGYKAQRKGMPPELAQQLPVLKELLRELGYKIVEKEGYEADDILGTLSATGSECYIATGDRDSLQLVDDRVKVMLASTKAGQPQTTVYDFEKVKEEYFVEPKQLIDVKALMGDSSDNVPGVAGIGQKTACSLVAEFGSIENIYDNLESLKIRDSVKAKLSASKDMAFLSKKLVTIFRDVPIDRNESVFVPKQFTEKSISMLRELELFKIIERLGLDGVSVNVSEKSEKVKTADFNIIHDAEALKLLLEGLQNKERAFFINCDGGIMIADSGNVSFVAKSLDEFENFKRDVLHSDKIEKITYDAKQLYKEAISFGYSVGTRITDVSLAAYLLNPSSSDYGISRLLQEYGVVPSEIQNCPSEFVADAEAVSGLPLLYEKLMALVADNSMDRLLYEIEMPLCEVLADMELSGFEVDADGIKNFGGMLSDNIDVLQKRIYETAGEEFNINSPKRLGEILFTKLGIKPPKKTKTGFSTSAEVLESLENEHPVVSDILQYRQLTKLKSTYCDGLLKAISADGRIHSTLKQTETRTGRISSTEPNLQNIPVRSELGRQMRKFFRAKDGFVLVDSDYSQIELRVLADIANDVNMIEAFNNGDDIHTITASQVFNMPPLFVTPEMRSRAKAVNFGIVYGIGAFSLSKDIGVSVAQADRYIKNYLHHYSGVEAYMESVVEKSKSLGYAQTEFGRRRYLPELSSSNANLRKAGERIARNMPIQGTAADIMKIAMIRVYKSLKESSLRAKLILQIHDELIVEASEDEAEKVKELLEREMENAVSLKVRLSADANVGKTWYDAKG